MACPYSRNGAMQRLFTTFPNSWPGAALLLLRLTCTLPLMLDAASLGSSGVGTWAGGLLLAASAPAVLLFLGLYTPVAALMGTLIELSLAVTEPSFAAIHLTRAAIGVALMGLGPGAWSLDSRIYGRKRIEL
ncbi:MAG: hypothetical protein JO161_03985 [Planctomycetaceae bacterium]|nr:hypothetical protein [Planctomycetaceae bacterium]